MLGVRPRWKTSSTGASTTTSASASASSSSSSSSSSSTHRTSSAASPPQDRNLPDPEGGIDELRCSIEHNITGSAVHASDQVRAEERRVDVWMCDARLDCLVVPLVRVVGSTCIYSTWYVSVKRGTHVACVARLRAPPRTKLHCHHCHTLTRHHASHVPHTPPHTSHIAHSPHTPSHTPHTSHTHHTHHTPPHTHHHTLPQTSPHLTTHLATHLTTNLATHLATHLPHPPRSHGRP